LHGQGASVETRPAGAPQDDDGLGDGIKNVCRHPENLTQNEINDFNLLSSLRDGGGPEQPLGRSIDYSNAKAMLQATRSFGPWIPAFPGMTRKEQPIEMAQFISDQSQDDGCASWTIGRKQG
jgi:hypothetical protein